MTCPVSRRVVAVAALLVALGAATPAIAVPEGQLTWGVHITLTPKYFDPGEMESLITPFMVMYAVHDGMAKAMPENRFTPSLAESWKVSPDGRVYDFTLRKGVKFHNGDPVTAEDVKFSFERYRGAAAKMLKERIPVVEVHRIQQLIHEKVMYAPIFEPAILCAYGPRVAEPGLGLITNMGGSAPLEELRLKGK